MGKRKKEKITREAEKRKESQREEIKHIPLDAFPCHRIYHIQYTFDGIKPRVLAEGDRLNIMKRN